MHAPTRRRPSCPALPGPALPAAYTNANPGEQWRPIFVLRTGLAHIAQSRAGAPDGLSVVQHIAMGPPALTPFVPVYKVWRGCGVVDAGSRPCMRWMHAGLPATRRCRTHPHRPWPTRHACRACAPRTTLPSRLTAAAPPLIPALLLC